MKKMLQVLKKENTEGLKGLSYENEMSNFNIFQKVWFSEVFLKVWLHLTFYICP